jgi:hypothetical protein
MEAVRFILPFLIRKKAANLLFQHNVIFTPVKNKDFFKRADISDVFTQKSV